jgi:hypothetical protein
MLFRWGFSLLSEMRVLKQSFLGKYAHFAKSLLIRSKKPFSQES